MPDLSCSEDNYWAVLEAGDSWEFSHRVEPISDFFSSQVTLKPGGRKPKELGDPFVLCLCNLRVDLNVLLAVISRASLPFHVQHLLLNNSSGSVISGSTTTLTMENKLHGEGSPQPQLYSAACVHP